MDFLLTRQARERTLRVLPSKAEKENERRETRLGGHDSLAKGAELDVSTTAQDESFTDRSVPAVDDLRNPNSRVEQALVRYPSPNRDLPPASSPPLTPPRQQDVLLRRPRAAATERIHSSLPNTPLLGVFKSNHVLVNRERARHQLPPYRRCRDLDELARQHASAMAQRTMVYHSVRSIEELRAKLNKVHVAENVQSGDSITQMHQHVTKDQKVSFQNIMGNFEEFGMATAKGTDGKLYLCQLFRR